MRTGIFPSPYFSFTFLRNSIPPIFGIMISSNMRLGTDSSMASRPSMPFPAEVTEYSIGSSDAFIIATKVISSSITSIFFIWYVYIIVALVS